MNLLTKGSRRHLTKQLGKTLEQHIKDIQNTIRYANDNDVLVNVYLEDWSNGIQQDESYVFELTESILKEHVERIMLPDTLGILTPFKAEEFVKKMIERFGTEKQFDFHPHNDYGLANGNVLGALRGGARGVHSTVNGLGERAGNVGLCQVVALINDHTEFKTNVVENKMILVSNLVESFSGKRVASNAPIIGSDVFTQTAGVHADGDKKGELYHNPLKPERFGRHRSYALTKLAGRANIEKNLEVLGIQLSKEEIDQVVSRVKELSDKKQVITTEDLTFIVADILNRTDYNIKIEKSVVTSGKGIKPSAGVIIKRNGKMIDAFAEGDGGYDALMNAIRKSADRLDLDIPVLVDYEVRIPKGGRTDALVEASIIWEYKNRTFTTMGVDSDQVVAAIIATEKMLNIVANWK